MTAEKEMSLAVALDFADNPRPHHALCAPADTNSELYEALRVIARAYRESLDRRKSGEGGEDAERLSAIITEYLSAGGLWNPESMEHDKVRRLLIDCRTEFDAAIADSAIKSAIAQVDAARTEGKGNG